MRRPTLFEIAIIILLLVMATLRAIDLIKDYRRENPKSAPSGTLYAIPK